MVDIGDLYRRFKSSSVIRGTGNLGGQKAPAWKEGEVEYARAMWGRLEGEIRSCWRVNWHHSPDHVSNIVFHNHYPQIVINNPWGNKQLPEDLWEYFVSETALIRVILVDEDELFDRYYGIVGEYQPSQKRLHLRRL